MNVLAILSKMLRMHVAMHVASLLNACMIIANKQGTFFGHTMFPQIITEFATYAKSLLNHDI